MADIPIILLAAGGSSRMGQAKQLLEWGGKTLIEFQVEKLLTLKRAVYVVLGASKEKILPLLEKYPINIVINSGWKNGMGTSVAAGIDNVLLNNTDVSAAVYVLVDQPLVSINHIRKLIDTFIPGQHQIIASRSENGWLGVPALLDASYFNELRFLKGDSGAKAIIKKHISKVISIDAENLLEDIDTPGKYLKLKKLESIGSLHQGPKK